MKNRKENTIIKMDLSGAMDLANAMAILGINPSRHDIAPEVLIENQEQAIIDILVRFGLPQHMGFDARAAISEKRKLFKLMSVPDDAITHLNNKRMNETIPHVRRALRNALVNEIEEVLDTIDVETRGQMGLALSTRGTARIIARQLVLRCMGVCEAMDFFSLSPANDADSKGIIYSLITGTGYNEVGYLLEKNRLESTSYRWYPAHDMEMSVLGKTFYPKTDESLFHDLEPAFNGKIEIRLRGRSGPVIETPYRYVNNVVNLVTQIAYKYHADRMGGDND